MSQDRRQPPLPTGRWQRLSRLTGTATAVSARHAVQKIRESFTPAAEHAEQRRSMVRDTARDVVAVLADLKGAALKVGQMLSLEPALLPLELRDALATLQRGVPPMPAEAVARVVAEDFGRPLAEVFLEFDPQPLGAASIGQVHRARAPDGTPLAVKVQYPGVAEAIDSDVDNLGSLLKLARAVVSAASLDSYLDGLRRTLRRETDYVAEAETLARYRARYAVFPGVRVPQPYPALTRRRVLSMELMVGRPLETALREAVPAERDALATRWVELFVRSLHELHTLHADPHAGNFLVDGEGALVLLDFGCTHDFQREFADGLVEVLRAVWRGEAERLPGLVTALGFGLPGGRPLDGELLFEWLELILAPFLSPGPFDFASWDVETRGARFLLDHPSLAGMLPPPPALFYFRVCAGIRGTLARTGARVDAHRLVKALDRRLRGLPPDPPVNL